MVFLQTTWLFGESLSSAVQNRIAESMELSYYFEKNENVGELDDASIYLVKDGAVQRRLCNGPIETFRTGDFFGEEISIFRSAESQEVTILEPAGLYRVPCESFVDIPIIRWKLFEAYGKHV